MVRRFRAWLSVLVLFSTVATAQFSRKEGKSSEDMKNAIMNSYLFKTTDIFYPAGTKQVSGFPQISESGLGYLETGLQQMLKVIIDLHKRNADAIGEIFKRSVPSSVQATVMVDNLNKPIAQGVVNEKRILEIRIDVHVLQATFRGSLLTVARDRPPMSLEPSAEEAKADEHLILDFLEFKRQVAESKAGSMWGDFKDKDDRWSKMLQLAQHSDAAQNIYVGTLMFIMAHEIGHFALGHHQHNCDPSQCEGFSRDELDADNYAGYLLGAWLAPKNAVDEMTAGLFRALDPTHQERLSGFGTFFTDTYSRVGFVDPSQSSCRCAYPDPKLRIETAEAGQKAALHRYQQLLAASPALAQKTTPMKVIVPKITSSVKDVPAPKAAREAAERLNRAEEFFQSKQYANALPLFRDAAKAGDAEGMLYLGDFYEMGWAVAQDYAEARRWFEKAAALGNSQGMARLGSLYYEGRGVPRDYQQARQWFEKAAALGNGSAMAYVGTLYRDGDGVDQDYQQAREWFEKGAAAGNEYAMRFLGIMYHEGQGVSQDYQQSRQWIERAAAAGDPAAIGLVGGFYYMGEGVPQDYQQARQWFEKGAAAGDGYSMTILGTMYQEGTGVALDLQLARQWYEKAAAVGNPMSMYCLGLMYEEGKGVERDYQKARQWYEKAANAGIPDAKERLEKLAK